jgi:hypothetical protein
VVELAVPPEGFRGAFLEFDAFHRERRIPIRRGRSRREAEQFYIRFCFPDTATADAFRNRFGGECLTGEVGCTGGEARAGRPVRNLWRAHSVCQPEPSGSCPKPVHEGSRDPARPPFGLPHSGGVLVGEPTRLTGAAEAAIKPPSFGTFAFTRALLLWTYSIQKGGKR